MFFSAVLYCVVFFKQKTAYEMRISDWSSDVCSSDLAAQNSQNGENQGVVSPGSAAGSLDMTQPRTIGWRKPPAIKRSRWTRESAADRKTRRPRAGARRVGQGLVRPCRSRGSPYP